MGQGANPLNSRDYLHHGRRSGKTADCVVDGKEQEPAATRNGFWYFKIEDRCQGKLYRLILTYCEEDFLGVINAFRIKE